MKRTFAAAAAFALGTLYATASAPGAPILYTFTGLRGGATNTCKWFDDNIVTDRSISTLTRQTDMLFNRIALPANQDVNVGGTAVTKEGGQVLDFKLGSATICTTAEAIYGPTPSPSPSGSP